MVDWTSHNNWNTEVKGDRAAERALADLPASHVRVVPDMAKPSALDVEQSMAPILAATMEDLGDALGARSVGVVLVDGDRRWVSVCSNRGDRCEQTGAALFETLLTATGATLNLVCPIIDPAQLARVSTLLGCTRTLRRIDVVCMSGRDGEARGALYALDSTQVALSARLLDRAASLTMRVLSLHDRLVDYRHVVTLSPLMSCNADADGKPIEMAQPLRDLLGIDPAQDLAAQLYERIHPDDMQRLRQNWRHAHVTGTPSEAEYRLRVASGEYRWFRSHGKARRDASGQVTRWCGLLEEMHDRRTDQATLPHLAYHDPLTGLSNRTHLRHMLAERVDGHVGGRGERRFALARLEISDLRAVIDTFGHAVGDCVLIETARRLQDAVRPNDLVAHSGGKEFLLLLEEVDGVADVLPRIRALLSAMRPSMQIDSNAVSVAVCVGLTLGEEDPSGPDTLLQNAGLALLRARRAGRDGCCVFSSEMDERMRRTQAQKFDLARALERSEFHLHYQPVLDARTGRVRSLEALLRWTHPTHGLASPMEFIPELEQNGLIVPVGQWVLEQACREAATWPDTLSVGVNLSAAQFHEPGLIESVTAALANSGLPAGRLLLEITESVQLLDKNENLVLLQALRALGVGIALDDFGTGYASLAYLQCFSFDVIKIDRSFVRHVLDGEETRTILRAVIRLSQALGSLCVAEGVETPDQLQFLRDENCNLVQGFLFSRPVEARSVMQTVALIEGSAGDRA